MLGVKFTAQTMIKTVGAENSAFQVYGVHQLAHQIMASKFGVLSITVPPGKTTKLRLAK